MLRLQLMASLQVAAGQTYAVKLDRLCGRPEEDLVPVCPHTSHRSMTTCHLRDRSTSRPMLHVRGHVRGLELIAVLEAFQQPVARALGAVATDVVRAAASPRARWGSDKQIMMTAQNTGSNRACCGPSLEVNSYAEHECDDVQG